MPEPHPRESRLAEALDAIRRKLGSGTIQRGLSRHSERPAAGLPLSRRPAFQDVCSLPSHDERPEVPIHKDVLRSVGTSNV